VADTSSVVRIVNARFDGARKELVNRRVEVTGCGYKSPNATAERLSSEISISQCQIRFAPLLAWSSSCVERACGPWTKMISHGSSSSRVFRAE
jgi:hypothetical protein